MTTWQHILPCSKSSVIFMNRSCAQVSIEENLRSLLLHLSYSRLSYPCRRTGSGAQQMLTDQGSVLYFHLLANNHHVSDIPLPIKNPIHNLKK